MKVFTGPQVRAWDAYTIEHEPVRSLDLMERAALACCQWIVGNYALKGRVCHIFCAKGNNGGDGLALARLLLERNVPVRVYILEFGNLGTEDFQANLAGLHPLTQDITFIQSRDAFPGLPADAVIVDALLGSGLNRPLEGLTADLVRFLNGSGRPILAIDLPTGLRTDEPSAGGPVIQAAHTLTLGSWKLGLLLAENAPYFGEVHLLPIGLDPVYEAETASPLRVTDLELARGFYRPRSSFSHKGTFGHALLVAGNEGKMGACVLGARACLHSGVGLLTLLVPREQAVIVQTAVPEAMALSDVDAVKPSAYKALGVGPGLGTDDAALELVERVLGLAAQIQPETGTAGGKVVIDADALNLLGTNPRLWAKVPRGSILTPHPKEFERLFGPAANDFERVRMALEKAAEHRCVIVLKGHRTLVATPDGSGYFNTTGNAGMATGGSGDVLTGILTGLLAQGYPSQQAAVLGVYLHGLAGDMALDSASMESLTASGIVDGMGKAFKHLGAGTVL
ncbi:MAG TPA: NAD(P)H-hydrate dehydratase [Dinghuibacter sp.]|uniref:NAD(P)H-hydrate dehydratase n=1 Tax=Dinghuibacter sp. TaxID=2024697 RepID=UPI002BD46EA0|nr:NAD(P)H-hydrate dehydratase [Dinghuibacter sp.]HTJ12610.1 NAD(P)H-hydrate dehydratase [Dinghuibacter sp.]